MPVYNVTFMEQMLRILRAKCVYCGHLRMHPAKVNFFTCKLRLLQHGLIEEAGALDNIGTERKSKSNMSNEVDAEPSAGSEDDSEDEMNLKELRDLFTKRAVRRSGGRMRKYELSKEKVEALAEQRRAVIKQFLLEITKGSACGHCNG